MPASSVMRQRKFKGMKAPAKVKIDSKNVVGSKKKKK